MSGIYQSQVINTLFKPSHKIKVILILFISIILSACSEKSSDEYIEEARILIESGDQSAAMIELKNAVQLEPRYSLARFELGKLHLSLNDYDSAEKELSRALELQYASNKVIPLLALAYHRLGANVALADLQYNQDILTPNELLEVGYRQIQAMVELEKTDEALKLINQLTSLDSTSVYKGLIEAYRFAIDKDYVQALDIAESVYKQAPLNRDVLGLTARLLLLNGKEKQATKMYEEYLKIAPEAVELKFALASMLIKQQELEKAETHINELMQINDSNGFLNYLKSVVRASNEDYPSALEFSENAIRFGHTDPRVRLIAGYAAYRLGEFDKAIGHLTLIEELLVDGHPALRILAESQLEANLGSDAGEILARLSDTSEQDADLFSDTAYRLMQEGDIDAAREIIEQTENISRSSRDLTRLGILKLSLNDIDGLLNLEQAVKQSPDSTQSKSVLGNAYIRTGQLDKASELAQNWQKESPEEIESFLLESNVLMSKNKYDEARTVLKNISSIGQNNIPYLTTLIAVNMKLEDSEEALELTEKLLQLEPNNIQALASLFAIHREKGNTSTALNRIKAIFQENREDEELAILLARSALSSNDAQTSLEALNTIEADRAAPKQFWPIKGTVLRRNGQLNLAEEHYKLWTTLFPKQDDAFIGQLILLESLGKYEDGIIVSENFLRDNNSTRVSILNAHFYALVGEIDNAKKALDTIDNRFSSLPIIRGINARIALLENRPTDAVQDALVAYEDKKNTNNLFLALRALQMSGEMQRSRELIKQHVTDFPNDIQAKAIYAESLIQSDIDGAIQNYKDILDVQPNNALVLNNLAYLLMSKNQLDNAEKLASRAYEIQSKNVAFADTFAQILVKQGKYEQAVNIYKDVVNDEVSNEAIILNYAYALYAQGSTIAADRILESREFKQPISQVRILSIKKEFNR